MKTQSKWGSVTLKAVLALVFVAPFFSSCVDLDEVWNKFDEVEARLDSLETSVNNQILALDNLLSGQIKISECKKNDDGSHAIVLSDGTKFTVYPKSTEYNTLLTYVEEGGVKYWAVYDAAGNITPLTGKDGKKIPVEAELPSVKEVDGEYIITIAGQEYTTGFTVEEVVTVFSAYELLKDDSGNVYAVTFTFGENMKFTVPLVDYKGFSFHIVGDVSATVIKDYYVDYGETSRVLAGMEGVVDYVMQIPDGWRVKEVVNDYTKETYLDITAPKASAVEAGAAVASGELKVVAVIEDGKSMVAKLYLSTEPFKKFMATSSNAVIEKYNGVDKVLYGLSVFSDFNKDALLAGAKDMLNGDGKGVSDADVNVALASVLGEELVTSERYVLWAIPVFYKSEGEDAGYFFKDGLIYVHEFGAVSATVDVNEVLFNDVTVSVKLSGFTSYYGGTDVKSDDLFSEILYQVNNNDMDPYTTPMTYNGSAFSFPDAAANVGLEVVSEETYVTWIIPVIDGKTEYSEDDIVYKEYTLLGVAAGGTVAVTSGTAEVDCVSINVPLSAENGTRIYYAWLTKRTASRYNDDTLRSEYLLANGKCIEGTSVTAVAEGLDPDTDMVLFAMATDAKGKYGEVLVENYTTEELVYNSLTVTVTPMDLGGNSASCGVSVSGGEVVEYVYWVGRETDQFWLDRKGSTTLDKKNDAQKYIALYPDNTDVKRAMSAHKLENGVLQMVDLKTESTYFMIILAKDSSGKYSKAGYWQFTTLAADLGNVVKEGTAEWEAVKSQVNIQWHENSFTAAENSNMSAFYSFDITVPSNLTAYILCASEEYFESNPDTQTIAGKILDIEGQCSRKYDAGRVAIGANGEYVQEPNWIDDAGKEHTGTLLNIYNFYVHGYPTNGFATYFANNSHGEGNCTSWEDGACSNYAYAENHIKNHLTLDYYVEYVKTNRGAYCTKQDVIQKAAQDLLEAYTPYYKDAKPLIYINDGSPLYMEQHYASGVNNDGEVMDDVYIVFKDTAGNYYEPMSFDVPNYFK